MIDRVVVLWLTGCVALSSLLYLELRASNSDQGAVLPARGRAQAPALEQTVRPPQLSSHELVATVLEHPVFSVTRKPPPVLPDDRPAAASETLNLRLTGIIIASGRHLAIFTMPNAKPLIRAPGEMLEGWRVDQIEPREVALSGPGGRTTLIPKADPNIVRTAASVAQSAAVPRQPAAPPVQRTAVPAQLPIPGRGGTAKTVGAPPALVPSRMPQ